MITPSFWERLENNKILVAGTVMKTSGYLSDILFLGIRLRELHPKGRAVVWGSSGYGDGMRLIDSDGPRFDGDRGYELKYLVSPEYK